MKAALVVLWLGLSPGLAVAEPEGYVQVGAMFTIQPAGMANHRVGPALGGATIGATATGGVFVTKTVALEGEVVASRSITDAQRFFYNWSEDYIGTRRDVFLVANVRWRPPAARRLEFVGGGGLSINTVANRDIVVTDYYPAPHT
jgi:hypothetical protein